MVCSFCLGEDWLKEALGFMLSGIASETKRCCGLSRMVRRCTLAVQGASVCRDSHHAEQRLQPTMSQCKAMEVADS